MSVGDGDQYSMEQRALLTELDLSGGFDDGFRVYLYLLSNAPAPTMHRMQ
jgi:hypothetical protein